MEYTHSDDELIKQPIGYWSWAANESVIAAIRRGLAEYEISQPQWWVLSQADVGERTRDEVTDFLRGYLNVGDALVPEIDDLLKRELIVVDGQQRVRLTPEGADVYADCAKRQKETRALIHRDIPEEEYLITMKVLQRMIHNTDGKFWHH